MYFTRIIPITLIVNYVYPGFGFTTPGTDVPPKINFRLQSTMNTGNRYVHFYRLDSCSSLPCTFSSYDFFSCCRFRSSSLIIATAPMHLTSLKFSSDERIKEDIDTIDADDILQVILRFTFKIVFRH